MSCKGGAYVKVDMDEVRLDILRKMRVALVDGKRR